MRPWRYLGWRGLFSPMWTDPLRGSATSWIMGKLNDYLWVSAFFDKFIATIMDQTGFYIFFCVCNSLKYYTSV